MKYKKKKNRFFWHLFTFPFIWTPLFFAILIDISMEIYHHICFPIYGLKKIDRSQYIQITDRAKLDYLSPLDKINCMYCGYANGLFPYLAQICKSTETYWCGIMHDSKYPQLKGREHHKDFLPYGDEEALSKSTLIP